MFTFHEEQLASPVGYFAAQPGQLLNNGRWKIIRKLGWGTHSSTWLAEHTATPGIKKRNSAIKIFTHKATADPSTAREMGILERSRNWGSSFHFPMLQQHFVEKSSWGEHLCLVLLPQGASLESLRSSNAEGGYLPLHVVKKIASETLEIIASLHKEKIIHGNITADNILLAAQAGWEEDLPRSTNIEMKNVAVDGLIYPVVFSQPLPHGLEWNSSREDISDLEIILGGLGHAQSLGPNISLDATRNILPPEAILGSGVDRKADIWMF
ncbi:unnamed protein product [Cyclocybe aegerita]|uniref:non-specific serine/threonine protein kinase n=1 Tax=Cyclocybe aegerita TaxID=1973307 RepID=A0A8S0VXL2_CYCAE|nr:unnamed protein product [Cyclocybe aegerita]